MEFRARRTEHINRKIAELEKQVQHLASVVNPGAQPRDTSLYGAAASFRTDLTQMTDVVQDEVPHTRSGNTDNTVLGQQRQFEPARSSSVNIIPDAPSSYNDSPNMSLSQYGNSSPPAIMPLMIETVQLTTSQIDTMFQV